MLSFKMHFKLKFYGKNLRLVFIVIVLLYELTLNFIIKIYY